MIIIFLRLVREKNSISISQPHYLAIWQLFNLTQWHFQFIGTGVMAQFVLSHGTFNAPVQVNIGWGFAIMFAVYLAWKISGLLMTFHMTVVLFIKLLIWFDDSHLVLYYLFNVPLMFLHNIDTVWNLMPESFLYCTMMDFPNFCSLFV